MAPTDIDTTELFRRYHDFVGRFAVRLGVAEGDVDDVVQEVFVSAHRHGGYIAGAASPTTWLARLTLGVASTHRRSRRRRREEIDGEVGVSMAGNANPAQEAETKEALARVRSALEQMDIDRRAVFVLFEIEGESCEQIAAGLEVPVGTVYSRLHAARRMFIDAHTRLLASEERSIASVSASSGGRI